MTGETGNGATLRRLTSFLRGSAWVFVVFFASRLTIVAVILLSRAVFNPGKYGHANSLLNSLTRWDGAWYISIARDGYVYQPGVQSNPAFFPFYPILVRVAGFLFQDLRLASVIVANACFLVAMLFFHALVKLDYEDNRVSRAAVTFLAFSPVSFFFSSAYTESTFLMLAVGAFLAARKQKWLLACLCGMCASATRNVGFMLVVPLLTEYIMQSVQGGASVKKLLHPRILMFALVPLGLGCYLLFCYLKFGDPLLFMQAHKAWDRSFMAPWYTIANVHHFSLFYRWLFLGALVTGVLLWVTGLLFRIRPSYLVFAGLFIGFNLCWKGLDGMPRFLSVIFPLSLVLGLLTARFKWSYEPLLAASVALLAICTALSATGYWMT